MLYKQFVSNRMPRKAWTVCGPVFQELRPCVLKHEPHVKFHDFDTMVEEKFLIDPGKIIILSQIGDLLIFDKFKHIFKSNLEYYKQTGKKKNFFILLTAFEYDANEVKEFEDILKIYFVPTFYEHYNKVIKINECDIVDDLKFHFLSYNGRSSLLRTSLFCYFYRKKLLGKSIFSYLGYSGQDMAHNRFNTLVNRGVNYYLNEYNFNETTDRYIPLSEICDLIPYQIKNESVGMGGLPLVSNIDPYNQTFCHLVPETYKGQHAPFFTEKIFKPIAAKQLFIIFGSRHSLKFLQDIGFKTFSPFIDESYDGLEQPKRFNAILSEIDRIAAMSLTELTKLKADVKSIVDYNYNHFYKTLPDMYLNDISIVSDEIDLLIPQQLKYF